MKSHITWVSGAVCSLRMPVHDVCHGSRGARHAHSDVHQRGDIAVSVPFEPKPKCANSRLRAIDLHASLQIIKAREGAPAAEKGGQCDVRLLCGGVG